MEHKEQISELSALLEKALHQSGYPFMAGYYVSFTEGLLQDLDLTEQQMALVTRRYIHSLAQFNTVH